MISKTTACHFCGFCELLCLMVGTLQLHVGVLFCLVFLWVSLIRWVQKQNFFVTSLEAVWMAAKCITNQFCSEDGLQQSQ